MPAWRAESGQEAACGHAGMVLVSRMTGSPAAVTMKSLQGAATQQQKGLIGAAGHVSCLGRRLREKARRNDVVKRGGIVLDEVVELGVVNEISTTGRGLRARRCQWQAR